MGAFEITKEMVGRVTDEQLRQLLRRLLEAEARLRGIPLSAIAVGGNQTAADGGVDGSIHWTGLPDPESWLPRHMIYFQAKAEAMPRAKLLTKMRPKGVARPIFAELAAASGAYIIFSSDDPSKSGFDARIAAMRDAMAHVQDGDKIALDFYGADKIARWTNVHPGVALWLLEQIGRRLARLWRLVCARQRGHALSFRRHGARDDRWPGPADARRRGGDAPCLVGPRRGRTADRAFRHGQDPAR